MPFFCLCSSIHLYFVSPKICSLLWICHIGHTKIGANVGVRFGVSINLLSGAHHQSLDARSSLSFSICGLNNLSQRQLWFSFLAPARLPTLDSPSTFAGSVPSTLARQLWYILLFFPFLLKYFILLLTFLSFHLFALDPLFPVPSFSNIDKKLKRCAGCLRRLSTHPRGRRRKELILQCAYAKTGFQRFAPCRGVYHASCIKVGPPFRSRRSNNDGLAFPPVHHWGCFICKACTVRAVTGRELHPSDRYLMCLERVRLLDIAWSWA